MKGLLYTASINNSAAAVGTVIPAGSIVRRYGTGIQLSGSDIVISKPGYYDISVSATGSGAAAGTIGISLTADGIDVSGAKATETISTADTEVRSMAFESAIRVFCCKPTTIQLLSAGSQTVTLSNLAILVKEI